jgi:predicted phage-related endonuclease
MDSRLTWLKAEIKEHENEKAAIENRIKDLIGDNKAGVCGAVRYTYKAQSRETITDTGKELLRGLNDPRAFSASTFKVLRRTKV